MTEGLKEFFRDPGLLILARSDIHRLRLQESTNDSVESTSLFFQMLTFYKDKGEGWMKQACGDFDGYLQRERANVVVLSDKGIISDGARFTVIQHEGKYNLLLVLHPQFHVDFASQRKSEVVHDVLSTVNQAVERLKQLDQEGAEFLTVAEVQDWLKSVAEGEK